MAKRYLHPNKADDGVAILQIIGDDPDGHKLAKCLFNASRTTDTTTHFDPAIHTLEAIASGLPGHRPHALLGECEDTDLPTDRYFRNAWEWSD
jgi:hypothetical protein